jgi:hypothetical protein
MDRLWLFSVDLIPRYTVYDRLDSAHIKDRFGSVQFYERFHKPLHNFNIQTLALWSASLKTRSHRVKHRMKLQKHGSPPAYEVVFKKQLYKLRCAKRGPRTVFLMTDEANRNRTPAALQSCRAPVSPCFYRSGVCWSASNSLLSL